MHRLLGVAVLLVLSTGCVYQRAMSKGARKAAAGDWVAAYEAYQVAAEHKPDEPDAIAARDEARDKVISSAIEEAHQALARSDYETAVASLQRAESYNPDDPEIYTELRMVEEAMKAELLRDWQTTDPREIYSLAVRARKLFPKADYLPAMFDHLRQHFLAQSEKLLDGGQFAFSLAALHTITEFEPDRAPSMAPLELRIRTAWADDLVAAARKHQAAKKLGAAAIHYARAYEVAQREVDLALGKKLAAGLAADALLTLKLETAGVPARAAALRTELQTALDAIPELELGSTGAELGLSLTVAPHRCTETSTVTPSSLDYVSGQVEKPNPAHQELSAKLAAALAEEKTAKTESEKLWPQLKAAEAELARLDTALQTAQTASEQAEAAYAQASQQLDSARQQRDALDAQLAEARASGGDVTALSKSAAEQGKRVAEWTEVLLDREEATETARKALAKIRATHEPASEAKDKLTAAYEALVQRRTTAQASTGTLSSQLATTPRTVMEDIHSTFRYEVRDWQRTCASPSSGTAAPTWTTTLPRSHKFAPAFQTTDRAHVGHAASGLVEDPKAYPSSDAELVAMGDKETAQAVIQWATALTQDFYARRIESTVQTWTTSPTDASSTLLGLYLGAPARLPPETRTSFQEAVKKQYGLEKLELLGP
jgi:tetratricopeptide (TPR) repeat protein